MPTRFQSENPLCLISNPPSELQDKRSPTWGSSTATSTLRLPSGMPYIPFCRRRTTQAIEGYSLTTEWGASSETSGHQRGESLPQPDHTPSFRNALKTRLPTSDFLQIIPLCSGLFCRYLTIVGACDHQCGRKISRLSEEQNFPRFPQ